MIPKFLKIPCSYNSDFGDLQSCTAFVSLEGLKETQSLMKDLRKQRPHSTILQGMSNFSFSDQPDELLEDDKFKTRGLKIVAKEYRVVTEFIPDCDDNPTIWNSDLEIFYIGETTLAFQYRMEIKHCGTIVFSVCIEEGSLNDIIEEWELLIREDDEEAWNDPSYTRED